MRPVLSEKCPFAAATAGSQQLYLNVYPAYLSQVVGGMDSLLQVPSGCFEQTTSVSRGLARAPRHPTGRGQGQGASHGRPRQGTRRIQVSRLFLLGPAKPAAPKSAKPAPPNPASASASSLPTTATSAPSGSCSRATARGKTGTRAKSPPATRQTTAGGRIANLRASGKFASPRESGRGRGEAAGAGAGRVGPEVPAGLRGRRAKRGG